MFRVFLLIITTFLISCTSAAQNSNLTVSQQMKDYYADGKAEINVYELSQERYGEIRSGTQVQIYVAEDFLLDKQVKNESYSSKNSTWVLKRIETRDFITGIYPYHMFSSSFTAFNQDRHPRTLKIAASSQEWCGTSYAQLNYSQNAYDYQLHSYFENEVDTEARIKNAISEEEIFTKLKMNPDLLPNGEFNLIPSQITSRFLHLYPGSFKSSARKEEYTGEAYKAAIVLIIDTPELSRSLRIIFENKMPYTILEWTETYSNKNSITSARLVKQAKESYWQQNSVSDEFRRKDLGLD